MTSESIRDRLSVMTFFVTAKVLEQKQPEIEYKQPHPKAKRLKNVTFRRANFQNLPIFLENIETARSFKKNRGQWGRTKVPEEPAAAGGQQPAPAVAQQVLHVARLLRGCATHPHLRLLPAQQNDVTSLRHRLIGSTTHRFSDKDQVCN